MRDAQKKKEFEEQKQKLKSIVVGAPMVNPVDALFGKPSSAVKKQPSVEEPPKDEQEAKGILHDAICMIVASLLYGCFNVIVIIYASLLISLGFYT